MAETTLSIRPGETIGISPEPIEARTGEHVYIGALIETPPFPGVGHGASHPLTVAVAQVYPVQSTGETAWGWIHLTPESKEELGSLMLKAKIAPGVWYYLLVTSDESRWDKVQP